MSKYQFHRMKSEKFQEMVQSLLETRRREQGQLIQFSSTGADGAREATWIQEPNHADYVRPSNEVDDVPKQYIFQVKFHDIGLRGWAGAGAAVVSDLNDELEKVTKKYQYRCHHYVLITNVPLTGASRIGTRDKISRVADKWKAKIPEIEVWDAADLCRMLDNNPQVRASYSDLILPGDVLAALLKQQTFSADRRENSFRGYLRGVANESKARAEEAGDDDPLPLSKVFIDQSLQLDRDTVPECYRTVTDTWADHCDTESDTAPIVPRDLDDVSSSFALLWGAQDKVMLLAGPGYGKSTITQFLASYHASRIVDKDSAHSLARRLKVPANWRPEMVDASCTLRFPFRIELRRYAKWRKLASEGGKPTGLASYIARHTIGGHVESDLDQDDVFGLIASNPTLLILDGLDEVPNKEDRDALLHDCDAFLNRCDGEQVDLQVVMSSRPQGYHGEFDRFHPLTWIINDLSAKDFKTYSVDWLSERIRNSEERSEADERIKRGMMSEAVRRLATTLLQATVMLTIVRKKSDIPEERHKLFQKYVDVVFQREILKSDIISRYQQELRLLHEMVGYQIHEAVSRGEAGVMPEEKFRDTVWKVWGLIRGDERVNAIPNEEINSIFLLATDRLVFLSGKGTNQSDIDFVIQPYREYFAASYMANHADLDAEKIFECLVARGPFWLQVLRFVAAMASPSQRLAWAFNAVGAAESSDAVESLVKSLPSKRAVMFAIPEFDRLQFAHTRNITIGCLSQHEWWTWLGQDWISTVLGSLRTGDAWRELWKVFRDRPTMVIGNRLFALRFFSNVVPKSSSEYAEFVGFVVRELHGDGLAADAMNVVLRLELDVDLRSVDENVILESLELCLYGRFSRRIAENGYLERCLPKALLLRIACTAAHLFHGSRVVWDLLGLQIETDVAERVAIPGSADTIIAVNYPRWFESRVNPEVTGPREASRFSDEYATYCFLLFDALRDPENASLHRAVWHAREELRESVRWELDCENVLGPSPDSFDSDDNWRKYRTLVKELFESPGEVSHLNDIVSTFNREDLNSRRHWVALLFLPSQWDYLSSCGLLSVDELEGIRETKWAQCVAIPNHYIEFVSVRDRSDIGVALFGSIPFVSLIRVAVELHNRHELVESTVAEAILQLTDPASISAEEISRIIGSVHNPEAFPKTWAKALMLVAIRVAGVDLRSLAQFWNSITSKGRRTIWMWMYDYGASFVGESVVAQLLALQDDAATELGIQTALQSPGLSPELSSELNRRISIKLLREAEMDDVDDDRMQILVSCLFRTVPTVEEIQVYSNFKTYSRILAARVLADEQIIGRITAVPQTSSKNSTPSLRALLSNIIRQEQHFPPRVRAAALDSLIQIDVLNCPQISESDWQVR